MVDDHNQPVTKIEEDDVIIFFNFRTDRGRQLTRVLTQENFQEFGMHTRPLYYVTMTNYDDSFKNVSVIYPKDNLSQTLGEVLEKNAKKQIRIAETEKYPHVTFFFSGGREDEFEGEKRLLCPSPKVATYDLKPEMSAYDIRDAIVPELEAQEADFICLNFANTDMVGHTGVMEAAMKAAEAVDSCLEKVVNTALENNYSSIIIADHGNSEKMLNADGTPNTAHTIYPVPIILVEKNKDNGIQNGILGDIAPTVLDLLQVPKPDEMTRDSLLKDV
jgi:2,3-bisphosphoglycerate-independent phosphoglycerate mutase